MNKKKTRDQLHLDTLIQMNECVQMAAYMDRQPFGNCRQVNMLESCFWLKKQKQNFTLNVKNIAKSLSFGMWAGGVVCPEHQTG